MADLRYGPVELMKIDHSDGFYRVDLNVGDIPKLGVVFPTEPGEEQLVAFPLVLLMGWTNSPVRFSSVTESITDLANARMQTELSPAPHSLDERAEQVPLDDHTTPSPTSELDRNISRARGRPPPQQLPSTTAAVPVPQERDIRPCPTN